MRILLVSDLHYTLKQLDWVVVGRGRLRPRRGGRRPPRHRLVRRARRADRRRARVPRPHGRRRPRSSRARATTTSTPATSSASAPRCGSTARARAGVLVDGARIATDDVLVTVCPWWDGPRTREQVDRALAADAAGGRRPHRGSGCTTRRPTSRRRAGPASATTATPTSTRGSTQHQPDLVLCGHVHQSPFAAERRLGRPHRHDVGRQRRPRARPGPDAHRDRHRRRAGRAGCRRRASRSSRSRTAQYSGSGSRSEPSSDCACPSLCIRLPSTTSTMPSPPSWSAYWCWRSAR